MMEIKLEKRVKYAGDVHTELMKAGFTPKGAAELLDHVPDADVSHVIHAAFYGVTIDDPAVEWGYCDNCDEYVQVLNFCPNCGARMDG